MKSLQKIQTTRFKHTVYLCLMYFILSYKSNSMCIWSSYSSTFSETSHFEGQSWQNPIRAYYNNQSTCLNGLQRPEQFWNNCNIVHLSGLQNPTRTYLNPPNHQSEWPIKARAFSESLLIIQDKGSVDGVNS